MGWRGETYFSRSQNGRMAPFIEGMDSDSDNSYDDLSEVPEHLLPESWCEQGAQSAPNDPAMTVFEDDHGLMYCKKHRREMCHECRLDFVVVNKVKRKSDNGKKVNHDKIFQKHAEKGADFVRAMAMAEAGPEAGSRPVDVTSLLSDGGGAAAQQRYEEIAETCAECGKRGKVRRCARCKSVSYCGKQCQESAWGAHKKECKRIAKKIENEQWFMGDVPILPPGHPRWANPTEEDKALARTMLAQGKTPEDVTNSGNPMLGGWMLGLQMESMMAGL